MLSRTRQGGVCGRKDCPNESSWSHDTFCVCHMRRGSKRTRQLNSEQVAVQHNTFYVLVDSREEERGGEDESGYVV